MKIQQSSNQNIKEKPIISVLPDVRKHLIPSLKNISKADPSAWVRRNPGGNSGKSGKSKSSLNIGKSYIP